MFLSQVSSAGSFVVLAVSFGSSACWKIDLAPDQDPGDIKVDPQKVTKELIFNKFDTV